MELLCEHGVTLEARVMAHRIALACMDNHHLWREMHLEDRAEPRRIFETRFLAPCRGERPRYALAAASLQDDVWLGGLQRLNARILPRVRGACGVLWGGAKGERVY